MGYLNMQFLPVIVLAPGVTDRMINNCVTPDGRRTVIIASFGPGGSRPAIHPTAPFSPALAALGPRPPRWT